MRNKGTVITWAVIILLALGVGGFFGVRSLIRGNKVAPFKPHMDTYVALANPAVAGPTNGPQGKVNGRMVTVDPDAREVDYVYFDLPDDLRAETPGDVGTVALIRWSKIPVGKYSDGVSAEVQQALVTVVSMADKKVVGQTVVHGGEPPKSRKRSASGVGSKPDTEVANYLKSLPRS